MKGICHDAFGTSQAGFCVNKGEKYCTEIRRACNRTRQHCYAPIFKQVARDALAEQSSAEAPGEGGACGAVSAQSGPVSEALKLKEEVQELRSQANRMENMLSDIASLLS